MRTGKVVPMRLDARRYIIIDAAAKGMTYSDMIKRFMEEWHMKRSTVEMAIQDALKYMRSPEAKETIAAMNMARLDTIISDSMSDKDRKNAVRAIDVQNKLAGGYEEKVKIEDDSTINLVFEL